MKRFIPCRKCAGNKKPGYIEKKIDNLPVLIECDCHLKWRKESELERKCIESNIRPDYKWEDYKGTQSLADLDCLKKYSKDFNKFIYKTMVYVYGPNGTQKTSMVQALGKELISNDYSVMYTSMNDLINSLISNYDVSEEEAERKDFFLSKCSDCDLLIIDESFDPKKVTLYKSGYQIPYLDSFLRSRFEISKKSIIFVSNVKPSDIEKMGYGKSIEDFIRRNTSQSYLEFFDNYQRNCNADFNPRGLFA